MKTNTETPKIYVADLAAYNEGKLIGEWLDLSDYSDGSDVMDAIGELLKNWSKEQGVEREEYAIQSEYLGESDFDTIIQAYTIAEENGVSLELVAEWVSSGHDLDDFRDAFFGVYEDAEDFGYQMTVDTGLPSGSDYYYITDTDKRLLATELSEQLIDNLDEEELIDEADMNSEKEELEEQIEKLEEELDEITSNDETTQDDLIEEKEQLISELRDNIEELIEQARERVAEIKYDEIYDALADPYEYFVNEQGMYSAEDFATSKVASFDYESYGQDLMQDYIVIEQDGMLFVFNN
jgi:antirestriction protein